MSPAVVLFNPGCLNKGNEKGQYTSFIIGAEEQGKVQNSGAKQIVSRRA